MTMSDRKILEVGDTLIEQGRFNGMSVRTVVRVTPTQAVLDDHVKLKIEHFDGRAAIGSTGYDSSSYYFDTPAKRAEMAHEKDRAYINKHQIAVPKNAYGTLVLTATACAEIVAIHKSAMLQISEIIKNEGLKNG